MSDSHDEARRMNSLKSTGPKTEDGKERSKMNALKHGLFVRTTELNDLPCSGDGDLRQCLEELNECYQPATPLEKMLIKRIAVLDWRLNRNHSAERKMLHVQKGVEYSLPPAGALERILKYERTMDRELYRAINQLEKLISRRIKKDKNEASSPRSNEPDLSSENEAGTKLD